MSPARRYGCSPQDDEFAASHVVEVFLLLFVVETVKRELCAAPKRKASGGHLEEPLSALTGGGKGCDMYEVAKPLEVAGVKRGILTTLNSQWADK